MSTFTLRGDAAPPSMIALLAAIIASTAVIAIAAGTNLVAARAATSAPTATANIPGATAATTTASANNEASVNNNDDNARAAAHPTIAVETCAPEAAVVFAHGRTTLPGDVAAQLAPIVAFSRKHPERTIVVDGHADPSGTELENLVLSKRRARHVADALVRARVPSSRIVVRAFGAYVPVVGEADAGLRRVQISFHADPCRKEAP